MHKRTKKLTHLSRHVLIDIGDMGDQTNILDDGDGIGNIRGWREDKPD